MAFSSTRMFSLYISWAPMNNKEYNYLVACFHVFIIILYNLNWFYTTSTVTQAKGILIYFDCFSGIYMYQHIRNIDKVVRWRELHVKDGSVKAKPCYLC